MTYVNVVRNVLSLIRSLSLAAFVSPRNPKIAGLLVSKVGEKALPKKKTLSPVARERVGWWMG